MSIKVDVLQSEPARRGKSERDLEHRIDRGYTFDKNVRLQSPRPTFVGFK